MIDSCNTDARAVSEWNNTSHLFLPDVFILHLSVRVSRNDPGEDTPGIKGSTDLSKQVSILPSSPSPTRAHIFCPTLRSRSMLLMEVNFGSFECCSEMEFYCEARQTIWVFSATKSG